MNLTFNPFETAKIETVAEKLGLKAGKATGGLIKISIFVIVGLTLGLIFLIYSLSKGFRKGFNEQKR
jgi:hypothetical protein